MSPQTVATTDRPAPSVGPSRVRPSARWVLWVIVILAGVVVVGVKVHGRIEADRLRQPLEAAERASVGSHKPIGLITPAVAARWTADASAVPEESVSASVSDGNAYLEPAFYYYFGRHGGPSWSVPSGEHCYYLAVQRGERFDAKLVSALAALCYRDGSHEPNGGGWVAIQ